MPRTGRVVLTGYAHHIVQRGPNRQAVFAEAGDYQRNLETLKEFKGASGRGVDADTGGGSEGAVDRLR